MYNVILRRRGLGHATAAGLMAASSKGIQEVRSWRNNWPQGQAGYLFRWGCTSAVPEGFKIVNTTKAIHWCSNKRQARLDMQAAGIPVPETWTVEDFNRWAEYDFDGSEADQFVLRPATHSKGNWLQCGLADEILCHSDRVSYLGGYVSRKIDKVAEYRVFVCQNRVVWVASKTPGNPDDVAWNVGEAGCFNNVRWGSWPLKAITAAMQAAKLSGTDFCGVDVMVDEEGEPYVLEVNSASSQTSTYRLGCLAKAFDYIIENGKRHFPDLSGPLTWKSCIHPAIWSR